LIPHAEVISTHTATATGNIVTTEIVGSAMNTKDDDDDDDDGTIVAPPSQIATGTVVGVSGHESLPSVNASVVVDSTESQVDTSPAARILPVLLPLGLAHHAGKLVANGVDMITDLEESSLDDLVEYGISRTDAETLYAHFHPNVAAAAVEIFSNWICESCTCSNVASVSICVVCGTPRKEGTFV
jgi:hypothetical protein